MPKVQPKRKAVIHPFRRWMLARGFTYAHVADLCRKNGWNTSANYLYLIASGWRGAGLTTAKFLSKKITRGAVSAAEFRMFERTRAA